MTESWIYSLVAIGSFITLWIIFNLKRRRIAPSKLIGGSELLKYRTISHVLGLFVLPEVDKRINQGRVRQTDLPLEIGVFRAIQKRENGKVVPVVEINEECDIQLKVKAKKEIATGQAVTLEDIYPKESFIEPPKYGGKPAAYFLCQSLFFDHFFCFDFQPNIPEIPSEHLEKLTIRYPILEVMNNKRFREEVQPIDQLKILADNNWPPGPGYFPHVITYVKQNPKKIYDPGFVQVVSGSYSRDYWTPRISFWRETNLFPGRVEYIQRAFDAHFKRDYVCSIYVIVPQFEGIIKDYLTSSNIKPESGFVDCVKQLKDLTLSRKVLIFPVDLLNSVFGFLESGSFWKYTGSVSDPSQKVNRHGIVHGTFVGFESESISLKYMILLDALGFVLMHDRVIAGEL